jgi:hypothetical protein
VIDWLTRRQTHGALHDKPLTVIGRATRCYSAVWSPGQIDYARGISGSRVVESITVPTLREAVSVNTVRKSGLSARGADGLASTRGSWGDRAWKPTAQSELHEPVMHLKRQTQFGDIAWA